MIDFKDHCNTVEGKYIANKKETTQAAIEVVTLEVVPLVVVQ